MKRELTVEERKRMGLNVCKPASVTRGWSNDQIKQAIIDRGFTIAEFERETNLPQRAVRDALRQRSPKTDKMIAAFLNVHESVIWPNRYFISGASIPKMLNVENQTDGWLAEYNAKIKPVTHIKIIDSWTGGSDGGPVVRYQELHPKRETAPVTDQTKNADGTVNHPWYNEPVAPDVPAAADEHFKYEADFVNQSVKYFPSIVKHNALKICLSGKYGKIGKPVSLPVGMNLDEKS